MRDGDLHRIVPTRPAECREVSGGASGTAAMGGGRPGGDSDGIPYIREEDRPEGEDQRDLEGGHHGEKARGAAGSFSSRSLPQRALPPLIPISAPTPTLRHFSSLFIFTLNSAYGRPQKFICS